MQLHDIARLRLRNQGLSFARMKTPSDVVRHLGAVQAQDYPASLWAIGLRMPDATKADIERAVAGKAVVRTWPMRGTLHFVPAEDARWMLDLLTPRVVAARQQRQLAGDEVNVKRARSVISRALEGGRTLTRKDAKEVLERKGVSVEGQRGYHVMGLLAQEGLICFGTHQGKQPAFVLLDEWAPKQRKLDREESLAELARRYFTSHGPATVHDFAWWSGLTLRDVRAGIELAGSDLEEATVDGKTFWLGPSAAAGSIEPEAHLLPPFDEYLVAYRDRTAALSRSGQAAASEIVLGPVVVIAGKVRGLWNRKTDAKGAIIEVRPIASLSDAETAAVTAAAERYETFVDGQGTVEVRVEAPGHH
ncbi:MAG TPA: winged helix DNA-binding domain-containing protein [Dehalococcoidia bacterium]|nr:winged helix DNA-binding domain-containing protein [Dehalococcoidia bacterium]